jgi:Uma2 family endonuclease
MAVQVLKRRFTVDEYYRMAEANILSEDDRVELLEGEIIQMTPIGSRHAACVKRLIRFFSQHVGDHALVSAQDPVHLDEHSEPQPDVAVLRFRPDFYAQAHPRPEEVLLLVEVAETSTEFDRQVKVPLYAQAGISEVWLVDLAGECLTVYVKPSARVYEQVQRFERGETVSPQALPELKLNVSEVLG